MFKEDEKAKGIPLFRKPGNIEMFPYWWEVKLSQSNRFGRVISITPQNLKNEILFASAYLLGIFLR